MSIAEKITTIAENVDKVSRSGYKTGYEIGFNSGDEHGYARGYADGKAEGGGAEPIINELTITENGTYTAPDGVDGYSPITVNVKGSDNSYYNDVWDSIQTNGTRTNYDRCFASLSWNDVTFKPKYDMILSSASYMFQYSQITDLVVAMGGKTIDFSNVPSYSMTRPFDSSAITHIGVVNVSNAGLLNTLFGNATELHTIDKLVVSASNTYGTKMFEFCSKLENIIIEGTIGNAFNMSACPLTTASVQSIIDHLADLTGATTKTLTLSASATITDAQKTAITAKNWTLSI